MSWLFSVIATCALLVGCGDDRISDATKAMIAKELETARISGFQARFAIAVTDMDNERLAAEAHKHPEVTLIILQHASGTIRPAKGLEQILGDKIATMKIQAWVTGYLAYGHVDGAARALVRAYSELLRTRAGYAPTRSLAPLPPPARISLRPSLTARWGLPLALLVLSLALRADSRRRRSRGGR